MAAWMNFDRTFNRATTLVAMACALLAAGGCKSKSTVSTEEAGAGNGSGSVDVLCIGDRVNDPPESFHYSYQYTDATGSSNKEADITPQAMDIVIKDSSGSHSYHGVRSDETSWNRAILDLSALNLTGMSSRLVVLNDSSAIARRGSETINGYDTTKYSIDTTSASAKDKQKFETLFGSGSFEKGTIWTAGDGCAVKVVLDEAVQFNGDLKKAHYEVGRVKK